MVSARQLATTAVERDRQGGHALGAGPSRPMQVGGEAEVAAAVDHPFNQVLLGGIEASGPQPAADTPHAFAEDRMVEGRSAGVVGGRGNTAATC